MFERSSARGFFHHGQFRSYRSAPKVACVSYIGKLDGNPNCSAKIFISKFICGKLSSLLKTLLKM